MYRIPMHNRYVRTNNSRHIWKIAVTTIDDVSMQLLVRSPTVNSHYLLDDR